ncbi:MAG: Rrf2 family transcriptional regulator [Kosmotoga sp.]|nr:MAG: Rrf2 family transcriptional regulator [Kosmotoga sp.]
MGFTVKSSYALKALYELAKIDGEEIKKLSLVEIADRTKVPTDFLEKILGELRQNGIVKSVRGRYGGYSLAKSPDKILVKDVILNLDKPLNSFVCIHDSEKCEEHNECVIKYVWFNLYRSMMDELGKTTIKDLLDIGTKLTNKKKVKMSIEEKSE